MGGIRNHGFLGSNLPHRFLPLGASLRSDYRTHPGLQYRLQVRNGRAPRCRNWLGPWKNCEVLPLNNGINYIGIYTRVFYLSICLSVCLAVCPSVCLSVYLFIYLSLSIYIICPCMCTYISLSLSFCECVFLPARTVHFFDFDLDLLLFGEPLGISTDLGAKVLKLQRFEWIWASVFMLVGPSRPRPLEPFRTNPATLV